MPVVSQYPISINNPNQKIFSIRIRQIPALAFLLSNEIPGAFNELKGHIPVEANSIVKWFEETYICRQVRRVSRNRDISWRELLFPPSFWSVYENNEYDFFRTNNSVEAWYRRPTQGRLNNAHELRIRTVLDDRGSRLLMTFLKRIAHNLSL
ncbi:18994_t:CDS:2 [Dentiscutata erythropus]|uniref:18994_t:CDS:1 n=1 Tax=Dentiscutata erythropus TaxID=1348616 RepID=A0A9N9IHD8_9GLOM|nr:18994_t:CDS:2 [Dentiscutata erythropus]